MGVRDFYALLHQASIKLSPHAEAESGRLRAQGGLATPGVKANSLPQKPCNLASSLSLYLFFCQTDEADVLGLLSRVDRAVYF